MKNEDSQPYVPLEVIREDRISFPSNGRNLSVKLANAEDFLAFISGAVNVVNIKAWSIFMRWNAINVGLEAGTLALTQEKDAFTLALAQAPEAEAIAEDFSGDTPASQAS